MKSVLLLTGLATAAVLGLPQRHEEPSVAQVSSPVPYLNESSLAFLTSVSDVEREADANIQLVPVPAFCDETISNQCSSSSQFDKWTFKRGLTMVGKKLVEEGEMVDMVILGHALITMLFPSRVNSKEMSFFLAHKDEPIYSKLGDVIDAVTQHDREEGGISGNRWLADRLHSKWLNNDVAKEIPQYVTGPIFEASVAQNEVVFEYVRPVDPHDPESKQVGLRVYATLWAFTLCKQLETVQNFPNMTYQIDMAAHYATKYLHEKDMESVSERDLNDMCAVHLLPNVSETLAGSYNRYTGRFLYPVNESTVDQVDHVDLDTVQPFHLPMWSRYEDRKV